MKFILTLFIFGTTLQAISQTAPTVSSGTDPNKQKLAQELLNKSVKAYQVEREYKKAFMYTMEALQLLPDDTTVLMSAGVYFGPAAEEYDKSLAYINQYLEKGGKNPEAYVKMISIYRDKKNDDATALKIIKTAEGIYPANITFPKYELNLYLKQKKYDLAQAALQRQVVKLPSAENYYLLGQLDEELGKPDSAKIAYQKSIDLNPQYYEPNFRMGNIYYGEAAKIKSERDKIGTAEQDKDKRLKLLGMIKEKCKMAMPYFEKCEQLKPNEAGVLRALSFIYKTLVMDAQVQRMADKMKALGLTK